MSEDLAQRQVFTCPITDPTNEFEVSKAKALIYQCAGEMGFLANHTPFQIQQFKENGAGEIKFRLESTFTA